MTRAREGRKMLYVHASLWKRVPLTRKHRLPRSSLQKLSYDYDTRKILWTYVKIELDYSRSMKPDSNEYSKRVFDLSKEIRTSLDIGMILVFSLTHTQKSTSNRCLRRRESNTSPISNEIKRNASFYYITRIFFSFSNALPFHPIFVTVYIQSSKGSSYE